MENSKHQFKCKDEIIFRNNPLAQWNYGVYSHPNQYNKGHILAGGIELNSSSQILPYKGYEDFVGTSNEPEPAVEIAIDTPVMALTDNHNWVYASYKGEDDFLFGKMNVMFSNGQFIQTKMIIPFDKFDPIDLSYCIEKEALQMDVNGFLHHIKMKGVES